MKNFLPVNNSHSRSAVSHISLLLLSPPPMTSGAIYFISLEHTYYMPRYLVLLHGLIMEPAFPARMRWRFLFGLSQRRQATDWRRRRRGRRDVIDKIRPPVHNKSLPCSKRLILPLSYYYALYNFPLLINERGRWLPPPQMAFPFGLCLWQTVAAAAAPVYIPR